MQHPMQRFQTPPGWRPEHEVPSCERGDFAVSRDPEIEYGVDYVGPYDVAVDGIGEACRRHALALDAAGLTVFLSSNVWGGRASYDAIPATVRGRLAPLTFCRYKTPLLRIVHTSLNRPAVYNAVFPRSASTMTAGELARVRRTTVIMTVHERLAPDSELKDLAPFLGMAGEVWVPSHSNRLVLIDSGVSPERVHVVPHPYDGDELQLFADALARSRSQIHEGFVFFTCSKWEPRKALHELIGAFLSAFRPQDGAKLALKTSEFGSWPGYPSDPASSLRFWLSDPAVRANGWNEASAKRLVMPIWGHVPRKDLIAMHCQADCYVCCARSEGFALPVLDAKLAGKRMVYVPCGGPEDMASTDDVRVDCQSLSGAHEMYGWGDAVWSGFTVPQLASALREAFERRVQPPPSAQLDRFSPAGVGAMMRRRIEAILDGLGGR